MVKIKQFFKKIGKWFVDHRPTKRRLIQIYAALLYNANIKGFVNGKIYTGKTKNLCVPGFNCYSCPGAIGACPLGSLQNALANSKTRAPFYVFGILILFGLLLGRTICGFLCPVGLVQELLYKIPTPKLKKNRFTKVMSYLKYVILAVFVVWIPLSYMQSAGIAVPAFCKFICPVGTGEGALFLLMHSDNVSLYQMLGALFNWKFVVFCCMVVATVFIFRFFCRFICPLGAIYGFFCRVAMIGIKLDKSKCTDCGLCVETCKMDIRHVGDHECIQCGQCIPVCPTKAISWKGQKVTVAPTVPQFEPAEVSTEEEGQIVAKAKKHHTRAFWTQVVAWSLALVVLIGALVYYNFIDKSNGINEKREVVEDFTVATYFQGEGVTFTLSEELAKGKTVVINFWYDGCAPCAEEMPEFDKLQRAYADKVTVLVVHTASSAFDGVDIPQQIVEKYGWGDYAVTFAIDNRATSESDLFYALGGMNVFPMTAVIDTKSEIVAVRQGKFKSYEELEQTVSEAFDS